jgi:hypothetical protein
MASSWAVWVRRVLVFRIGPIVIKVVLPGTEHCGDRGSLNVIAICLGQCLQRIVRSIPKRIGSVAAGPGSGLVAECENPRRLLKRMGRREVVVEAISIHRIRSRFNTFGTLVREHSLPASSEKCSRFDADASDHKMLATPDITLWS